MMTRTLAILFLAASPLLTEAAGTCRAKTEVEAKAARRKAAGCTGTAPTGGQCSCSGNRRSNATFDCKAPAKTGWESTGKKCVTARPDKNAAWDKHDWAYPADYWNYCPPTDPSRPGSPATALQHWPEAGSWHCTQVSAAGVTHSFTPGDAGYNSSHNAEDWCTKAGCYVDPCTCDKNDIAASSWFQGTPGPALYYSYSQCGASDTFTATECAAYTTSDTCTERLMCNWDTTGGGTTEATTSKASTVATTFAATLTVAVGVLRA